MESAVKNFAEWNTRLYFISLFLLLASVPLSKYTTSLSQFLLLGCWLAYRSDTAWLEEYLSGSRWHPFSILRLIKGFLLSMGKSLISKFAAFFRNKAAMAITSLLLLHVIGLIYTTDFHYALKDLRTKLPLFILPLFLSTGPELKNRTLNLILIGYVLAVFGGTIYRIILFLQLPVADTRALDAHISHIRFSLNLVFSVFILLHLIRLKNYLPSWQRMLFAFLILWFVFFLFYMRYSTGIVILLVVSTLLLSYLAFHGTTLRTRLLFITGVLVLILVPAFLIHSTVRDYRRTEPVSFSKLDRYTSQGNSYYHDTVNFRIENGHYVGLYICDKELREAWAERSAYPIDSLDSKQQKIRFTLVRYLASMELRKDSAGISQLTDKDIHNIEAGMTRRNSGSGFNIKTQVDNFLVGWDNYKRYHNANANSLIQRFEYWRTSLLIIRQNPIFGVGTGDVPEVFRVQYEKMNSSLDPQFRLRSHNQFLSLTVAFGIMGLLWFVVVLVYPVIRTKRFSYYYLIFWIIFFISIFTEDTLETQEGVTFYALFTSMFLLAWKDDENDGNIL